MGTGSCICAIGRIGAGTVKAQVTVWVLSIIWVVVWVRSTVYRRSDTYIDAFSDSCAQKRGRYTKSTILSPWLRMYSSFGFLVWLKLAVFCLKCNKIAVMVKRLINFIIICMYLRYNCYAIGSIKWAA